MCTAGKTTKKKHLQINKTSNLRSKEGKKANSKTKMRAGVCTLITECTPAHGQSKNKKYNGSVNILSEKTQNKVISSDQYVFFPITVKKHLTCI